LTRAMHNVDWEGLRSLSERRQDNIRSYDALDLFVRIAEKRKYSLQLSPKKYVEGVAVEYHAIALPHGANQKPIKGEGRTPEEAIFDLYNKLGV
jgi:hypothetical protein